MPRIFSARMAEALKAGMPRAILVQIDHPSGTFYGWSGVGQLHYNDQVWTGFGVLGTISPVKTTSDLSIQEVSFSLSGVSTEALAMLDGEVRNREAQVWLACLNDKLQVIPDPWLVMLALLDYQQFSTQEDGSATIQIIARSGFYTLERALRQVWSPESQKQLYPDDTGLDLLPSLQNQEIAWTIS